jgi:glycosyltransferase involved in cell wall biosynthesis
VKLGFIYDAVYPWIKGGGEKTLYELASALRDRGHECHLFGMHLWDGPADIEREGLHYHAICQKLPLYGSDGKRRATQPLRFAAGLYRRLPRYDLASFDLFDVHAFPFFSVPAFAAVHRDRMPQVPWLLTWLEVWGDDYWRRYLGWKGRLGAGIERWSARLGPHHLCISPTTGRRLERLLGVAPSRVSVIPRGFAPPDDPPVVARRSRRCVAAGRLLSYKRVDLLVRAWPTVLRRVPDAELTIVGGGPERESLERLTQELDLTASIRFLGELPEREQVLAEIAEATLLLQPSVREGQSTVVLEALLLGTPVLAAVGEETAVGDFLGPLPAVEAARLDAAAGPEAWGVRIAELLNDESRRCRLADEGRRAVASLGWKDHIAPQVEELYRRLIAPSR